MPDFLGELGVSPTHRERRFRPPFHRGEIATHVVDTRPGQRYSRHPAPRYRPVCNCGWEGAQWTTMVEARKEGNAHLEAER